MKNFLNFPFSKEEFLCHSYRAWKEFLPIIGNKELFYGSDFLFEQMIREDKGKHGFCYWDNAGTNAGIMAAFNIYLFRPAFPVHCALFLW